MSRRNRRPCTPSLFPFLSILACIIGVLTLVIAGLALVQPVVTEDGKEPEEACENMEALLAEHSRLEAETAEDTGRLTRLEAQIAEVEASARGAEEDVQSMEGAVANRRDLAATVLGAEEDNWKLREAVEGGRRRLEEENRLLASLGEEKAAVEREAAASAEKARAAADSVGLRFPAGGKRLNPRFIECTTNGLILDPDLAPGEERRVSSSRIKTHAGLKTFFQEVKSRDGWTVIFLIRPGGVEALDAALEVALDEKVRHGCLPVPGRRRIDFESIQGGVGNTTRTE